MRSPQRLRKIGFVLSGFAILGMLFSLLGTAGVWIVRPSLTRSVASVLDLSNNTLVTTQSAIAVLSGSLDQAEQDLGLIQSSLETLSGSMEDISASLTTSGNLIGDNLSLTVTEVQVALVSAAASAEFIDDTLAFIAAIPLIGADYQPETSLHLSLGKVAENLEDVPDSLAALETTLVSAADSLEEFSADLAILSADLETALEDLGDAESILAEYDGILTEAISKVEPVQTRLNLYSVLTSMFLSGVLLWLGVALFSVYLQAQDYIHYEDKIVSLTDLEQE